MNIIIANTQEFNPQIGGVERTSSILANELVRLGHNVFFVAYIRSPFSKEYTPVVEQFLLPNSTAAINAENILAFTQFVVNKNVQIILNQAGNILDFTQLCAAVKEITKIKLISEIHINPDYRIKAYLDFSPSKLKSQSTIFAKCKRIIKCFCPFKLKTIQNTEEQLYQYVYTNSEATVLLSEYYKPPFLKLANIKDASKLTAIANPLSLKATSVDWSLKRKQLLYVGRFDYKHKRPDRALEIWACLYEEFPEWELIMLGDGPAREELIELSVKLNLNRVVFAGFKDPVPYYKTSSIIIMTSAYEGFPMVLTEAAQYGVVPIAFNTFESLKDIIEDGVSGYTINSPFIKQCYKALSDLMSNSDLRIKMAKASMAHTSQFAPVKIVNEWQALFHSIIEGL